MDWRLALAAGVTLLILVIDVIEPADTVSICFAYTLPILIGVYSRPSSSYILAVLATVASLLGSFARPPEGGIALSFVANRVIAVAAQWLVAVLVEHRRRTFTMVKLHLEQETHAAETGRRFVHILTHEIATALTSIDGQSYRLAKLADAVAPDEIRTRTVKIRSAANRLMNLVERIGLAAKIGRGEIDLKEQPVDLPALVDQLVTDHEGTVIQVNVLMPASLVLVADRDLVFQALANLVSNAVKFSPPSAPVRVTIRASREIPGIEIAVEDQGFGIPPEDLSKVFDAYFRADNSRGIPGFGVGLHLVRHFVEAHGGRVTIESELGRGTIVSLHLPARLE